VQLGLKVGHGFEIQTLVEFFKELRYAGIFLPKQLEAQGAVFWRPQQNTDIGKLASLDVGHKTHDGVLAR
jgi:hypothetical protein